MNDNEATVMRLTEQAKILKEEIRRLERNVEREKETQNLEYLKNILLKVSVCVVSIILSFVLLNLDMLCICKQCRPRSVGF